MEDMLICSTDVVFITHHLVPQHTSLPINAFDIHHDVYSARRAFFCNVR